MRFNCLSQIQYIELYLQTLARNSSELSESLRARLDLILRDIRPLVDTLDRPKYSLFCRVDDMGEERSVEELMQQLELQGRCAAAMRVLIHLCSVI